VAERLEKIAAKKGFRKVRVSGAEPTVGRGHLVELVNSMDERLLFILETNGILIGDDESYAREFADKNVHVRVALKGATAEEFALLTGVRAEFYDLPLKALVNLEKAGASYHAAIMTFSRNTGDLCRRLEKISPSLSDELEFESLMLFPHVRKGLERKRIEYFQ